MNFYVSQHNTILSLKDNIYELCSILLIPVILYEISKNNNQNVVANYNYKLCKSKEYDETQTPPKKCRLRFVAERQTTRNYKAHNPKNTIYYEMNY